MEAPKEMNEIGSNVYCIKTHSNGVVIKGKEYPLLNILKKPCCGHTVYDVAVSTASQEVLCVKCGSCYPSHGIHWIDSKLFAKQVRRSEAITELLESQKFNESKEERIDNPVKIEQR